MGRGVSGRGADSSGVEGVDMPKVTQYKMNCKLCKLYKQEPRLWAEVHNKVIEGGMSQASVCKWLNVQLEVVNVSRADRHQDVINKFNAVNFKNHFDSHIEDEANTKRIVRSFMTRAGSGFDGADEHIANALLPDAPDDLYDYQMLQKMVDNQGIRLAQLDRELADKLDSGKKLQFNDLEQFQSLLTDLMKSKETLIKIKTKEKVVGAAVKAAMEVVLTGLLQAVSDVTTEVVGMLYREMPGSSMPNQVSNLIKTRITERAKEVSTDALDKARREFSIR